VEGRNEWPLSSPEWSGQRSQKWFYYSNPMAQEEPQPQPTDAVLGGTDAQPRPYDAVLGGTKGITLRQALPRIDQAAKEKLAGLNLSGLGLEELPPEIGKCTHLTELNRA
jgi:hypothetical protein